MPDEEDADEAPQPSRLEKTAAVAAALLRHKHLLVAAMELLRQRGALNEEEQVKIMAAYEQGSVAARSAIHDLLEKLQVAHVGSVVIDLANQIEGRGITAKKIQEVAQPYLAAAKEAVSSEAAPYIERAKQRLSELKALEEPTLRRLEAMSANLRGAGQEIGKGLHGMGREAADELVRRGKRWWMSPATEELEREFLDFVLNFLPKAERALVRTTVGVGIALLFAAVLVAAREFQVMEEIAIFASIFVLVLAGLALVNWGVRMGGALKGHAAELERLAQMSPAERRVVLTRRWAQRAEAEGIITSNEAQTVIMQTLHALPQDEASPPAGSR